MSDTTANTPEQPDASIARLNDLLGYARAHAATGDSRVWVDDPQRMLAIAWDLMTTEQRVQFREHPDMLALIEAAGYSSVPP